MIESLHSPHVGRVKALVGSQGVRERKKEGLFVAEGAQCLKEALHSKPQVKILYLTAQGRSRVADLNLSGIDVVDVSENVMEAMSTTMTPQGILALCELPKNSDQYPNISRAIYLNEIQDPGNAGTILRSADAMGIDAVFTSPGSVDMYSPKVVRSTAGSLWHIPLFEEVSVDSLTSRYGHESLLSFTASAKDSLESIAFHNPTIALFGNEARGLSKEILEKTRSAYIPMKGRAESLNLSAAASIVMYEMSQR